jgi:hypothetical protein
VIFLFKSDAVYFWQWGNCRSEGPIKQSKLQSQGIGGNGGAVHGGGLNNGMNLGYTMMNIRNMGDSFHEK